LHFFCTSTAPLLHANLPANDQANTERSFVPPHSPWTPFPPCFLLDFSETPFPSVYIRLALPTGVPTNGQTFPMRTSYQMDLMHFKSRRSFSLPDPHNHNLLKNRVLFFVPPRHSFNLVPKKRFSPGLPQLDFEPPYLIDFTFSSITGSVTSTRCLIKPVAFPTLLFHGFCFCILQKFTVKANALGDEGPFTSYKPPPPIPTPRFKLAFAFPNFFYLALHHYV